MASLTGQTIQSTYDGLLKTSDSDAITSTLKRITDGLGNFTPLYLSSTAVEVSSALTATSFIRTGGTSSQFLKADGSVDSTTYTPTSRTLTINGETYDLSANRSWTIAAGVTSFNTRTGAITLTSGDVTSALGFTPYNATNPAGYISGITRTQVINALATGGSPFEFLKSDGTVDTNSYVTFGRTITINGTTQDLSADRTFNVGTVTSVSGTGTVSGLTLTGSVTSSGSLTLGGTLTLTSGQVTSALGYTPVPNTRTLTINGTTFDLTADRSWTISGGISSLNGLTGATQTFATGTSGADFNISSVGTTHTFNIPTASSSTRGLLSAADWVIFANRISGSGTTNFVPKFNGATSLANSLIFDNGTNVGINTTSPTERLHVVGNGLFSGSLTAGGDIVTPTRVAVDTINGYTGGSTPITIQTGGAQAVVLGTSATERMRITSGGNVGIGTTNPNQLLSVGALGSTADTGLLIGSSTTSTGNLFFGDGTGIDVYRGYLQYNHSNDSLIIGTSSTERMRITSAGNVGIGNANPQSRLDVNGVIRSTNPSDAAFGLAALELHTFNGSSVSAGTSLFSTNHNFTYGTISSNQTNLYGVRGGGIRIATGVAPIIFSNGNADIDFAIERMRITSAGNVGIGTTNPQAGLVLQGFQSGIGGFRNTFQLRNTNSSGNQSNYIAFGSAANDALCWILNDLAANGTDATVLSFGNTGGERMRIASNGNVGIGTSSPVFRLDVNGTIQASGDVLAFSDISVKENIRPIDNALERVLNSRGVVYDRIDNEEKDNIGFIAQELEVNFPELVSTKPDGTKSVKYQNAVAILFEAIKQQQAQIDELKKLLN